MTELDDRIERGVAEAVKMIGQRHQHHRNCIHNMPPEEQIEMRGKTVEWWTTVVGSLPVQITADDWEIEAPEWTYLNPAGSGSE